MEGDRGEVEEEERGISLGKGGECKVVCVSDW